MAFAAPIVGTIAKASVGGGGAIGTAGKAAVAGFSSLLKGGAGGGGGAETAATSGVADSTAGMAPATAGGSAISGGATGQGLFGGPIPGVGDMSTPGAGQSITAPQLDAQGGGGIFSKLAQFSQTDTGKGLLEASRQGKPLNLYPQNDPYGGNMQLSNMAPSQQSNALQYLREFLMRR